MHSSKTNSTIDSCRTRASSKDDTKTTRSLRSGAYSTSSSIQRNSVATSTGSTTDRTETPKILKTSNSGLYGRLAFLAVLLAAAAGLGYAAYAILSDAEQKAAAERFESIAERALDVAQLVIGEKKKATDSLALMMGSANPDAAAWPNVYLEGYPEIASSLRIVTEGSLSFGPIVTPGGPEQASFEQFAYHLFRNMKTR